MFFGFCLVRIRVLDFVSTSNSSKSDVAKRIADSKEKPVAIVEISSAELILIFESRPMYMRTRFFASKIQKLPIGDLKSI